MRVTAQSLRSLFAPSECDRRWWLQIRGVEGHTDLSEFDKLLMRMGVEHETRCRARLEPVVDLSEGDEDARVAATERLLRDGSDGRVLYQAALRSTVMVDGTAVEVAGSPDFLIPEGLGWRVRDAKLAREHANGSRQHQEYDVQLGLYGLLLTEATGLPPMALEVETSLGDIAQVDLDAVDAARGHIARLLDLRSQRNQPDEAVGWTKCKSCAYRAHCWEPAMAMQDVATLPHVDTVPALTLYANGVRTSTELLERFDEESLADLPYVRPVGRAKRFGTSRARKALAHARAFTSGEPQALAQVQLPDTDTWAMFDIEGLPPRLDAPLEIFLWGYKVFGAHERSFVGVVPERSLPTSDEHAWREFLVRAGETMDDLGDIPFVHWHHYDSTNVDLYLQRYGDDTGVAKRLLGNLFDLLPAFTASVAMPLPSYSLKVVEQHLGFARTTDEVGGDWAIAAYLEACDTDDDARRTYLINQLCLYNEEDLDATWEVLQWLLARTK